ncbi:hypothetical protein Tco_1115837 [Tanacetum coccineum]
MERGFLSQKYSGRGRDKAGNPLKKVEFLGEYESEYEVASIDNDMARSMAYERVGFGTQSLLEQWRDSYGNGDYDDDSYDDDMYEGQDLSHELQAICDYLDIRVRGIGVSTDLEDTMNDYTPIGVASAVQEGVTPSVYARAMIELRADVELKDNIVVAMPKIAREGHYTCNIYVEYEWKPPRKPNASSSANKKKGVEPTIEFKDLLSSGQAILMDDARNPLKKVEFLGFGTQSLLEQWRDSYGNGDYGEDPYDDDMYEGQDLPQDIQAICDNLDIRIRGRRKK